MAPVAPEVAAALAAPRLSGGTFGAAKAGGAKEDGSAATAGDMARSMLQALALYRIFRFCFISTFVGSFSAEAPAQKASPTFPPDVLLRRPKAHSPAAERLPLYAAGLAAAARGALRGALRRILRRRAGLQKGLLSSSAHSS